MGKFGIQCANALEELNNSKFALLEDKRKGKLAAVEVTDAAIFYCKFNNDMDDYGHNDMHFELAITEDVAKTLSELGMNVKVTENEPTLEHPDSYKLYHIKVKVDMIPSEKNRDPAVIKLHTDKNGLKRTTILNPETVRVLDNGDWEDISVLIGYYYYKNKRTGEYGVTPYLKLAHVEMISRPAFDNRYDDYPEEDESERIYESADLQPETEQQSFAG